MDPGTIDTARPAADRPEGRGEAHYLAIFNQTAVGVVQIARDGRIELANRRWLDMTGYSEAELRQLNIAALIHPADRNAGARALSAIAAGSSDFLIDARFVRKDGSILHGSSSVSALRDEAGRFYGIVAIIVDVSDRKRSEAIQDAEKLALERAVSGEPLASSLEPLVQAAADQLGSAATVFVADREERKLRLVTSSGVREEWAGLVNGFPIAEGMPSCGTVAHTGQRIIVHDVTEDRYWTDFVAIAHRNDIAACWSFPVKLDADRVLGTFAILNRVPRSPTAEELRSAELLANAAALIVQRELALDESRRSHRLQKLLVDELSHRVKNTLATVQSIAAQTFKADAAEPAARQAFESRLMALSSTHGLLTRHNWESVDLPALIDATLRPFQDAEASTPRLSWNGPPVLLTPKVALALSMALHELASNASKHGALSAPQGAVAIRWSRQSDGGNLALRWEESGGPAVTEPVAKGFGSRLLERSLPYELGCEVELNYASAGVTCAIRVPLGVSDA